MYSSVYLMRKHPFHYICHNVVALESLSPKLEKDSPAQSINCFPPYFTNMQTKNSKHPKLSLGIQ